LSDSVDILVIGGGVNGTGVARDAAGRGLKVVLCEKDDLAEHTSSSSTKLIHGGLRYLEHYEFKLVRESLIEREVLLRAAPHIIWPLRFVLPHHKGLRPAWLIRLGLFFYDHLGGRKLLPPTTKRDFATSSHGSIMKDSYRFGFEYSDCWVEDSRLVVLNAVDAHQKGATILTRTECKDIKREGDLWKAILVDQNGSESTIRAKAIVNAAGPWVDNVIHYTDRKRNRNNLRLVKGSHLITRKLFEGDDAYILQNSDDRIVFAIPYEKDFTLVGTTDVAFSQDEGKPEISDEETVYLLDIINEYFKVPLTKGDIVTSYSGVRPLYDDQEENASVVTRDYVFDLSPADKGAPILSIFGGKITTYRKLSEQAVDKLEPSLLPPTPGPWTRDRHLPGGDIANADFAAFQAKCLTQWPNIPEKVLHRLLRAYGTKIHTVLADHSSVETMGQAFGAGLYELEVRYLVKHEFVTKPEDVLWRRSKLSLHMTQNEIDAFSVWFQREFNQRDIVSGGKQDFISENSHDPKHETQKEFHNVVFEEAG